MHTKKVDSRLQSAAWGLIILLLGGLSLIPGDQTGIFVLGIGIILLGLNLFRYVNQLPTNAFSIVLGVVALGLGGVASLRSVLGWDFHFDLPLFPILLIAFGLYLLIPSQKQKENG
jgi:hypothetical protein